MAILKVEKITKTFESEEGKIAVLEDISFSVEKGEFLSIIGPSGCGKSTLLRLIAGLEKPSGGNIFADGQKIEGPNPKISFIFQNFALFPWLSVRDNIAFPLKMANMSKQEIQTRVASVIKEVDLLGFEKAHPKELSGGMKQRVGIARALVLESDIILADEPFSALDAFTAKELRDDLLKIWQKFGKTIVLVTHLVEEAVYLSDSIVVLSKRPGRVEKIISNQLPRPRKTRTDGFYRLADELTAIIKP